MRADSFTSCTTQLTGFKQYLLSNGPELQKSTWPTPASGSGHVLLLFRLEAVSYTHLDVYKRQAQAFRALASVLLDNRGGCIPEPMTDDGLEALCRKAAPL